MAEESLDIPSVQVTNENLEDKVTLNEFESISESEHSISEKAVDRSLSSISSVDSGPDPWDSDIEYEIEGHEDVIEEPEVDIEWDNLTKEESEERINILLIVWTILSLILATTLLNLQPKRPKIRIYFPIVPQKVIRPRAPHILLIYYQGQTIDYPVHSSISSVNDYFRKLPTSDFYFPFFDNETVYVAYGDGRKDVTRWHGHVHRRIPNSKYPVSLKTLGATEFQHVVFGAGVLEQHIGDHYWTIAPNQNCHESRNCSHKSYLWSFRKERWIDGPNVPEDLTHVSCITALNRTHALIIGQFVNITTHTEDNGLQWSEEYLVWRALSIDLLAPGVTFTFVEDFPTLADLYYDWGHGQELQCATVIDKRLDKQVLLAIPASPWAWKLVTIAVKTSTVYSVSDEIPNGYEVVSLIVASGIMHVIVPPNPEGVLGHIWHPQNNTFEEIRNEAIHEIYSNLPFEQYQNAPKGVVYLSQF